MEAARPIVLGCSEVIFRDAENVGGAAIIRNLTGMANNLNQLTKLSQYLLPIIKPFSEIDERKQYIYTAQNINRSLKVIGNQLGLSVPLTMYVARHAWASIAKSKNVPISVINEGMGHDSEATTRIYLASLDTMAIDKANSMILKSL